MAMAILDSVTVSMAEVIKGIFRVISLVNLVDKSTSLGNTSDSAGISRTSSKVSPSFTNFAPYSLITLPPLSINSYSVKNIFTIIALFAPPCK